MGRAFSTLLFCLVAVPFCLIAQQRAATPASEVDRAIEEFKVQTRNLGIRADSPPKKGTNGGIRPSWHGRLYENFRNDALDAVRHEIRQRGGTKNLLRRNQFGFNIGGPVYIPKVYNGGRNTFFSLSYEGVRERISRTYLTTIPTTQERTGDYSSVVDQAGDLLPIFDPKSTRVNPDYDPTQPVSAENLQYVREQFPGNRIPASRLDPEAQRALTLYPQPNTAVGPFFRNNYFVNSPETNVANGMILKVDHTLAERNRLGVEVAFSNGLLGAARYFPSIANPGPPDRQVRESACRCGARVHLIVQDDQYVFGARNIEFLLHWFRGGDVSGVSVFPISLNGALLSDLAECSEFVCLDGYSVHPARQALASSSGASCTTTG